MTRRLFTLASAISLLLCIGIIWLWVRSRTTHDRVSHYGPEYLREFDSDSGRMLVSRTNNPWPRMAVETRQLMAENPAFAERARHDREVVRWFQLAEPHWSRLSLPAYNAASSLIRARSRLGFGYATEMWYGDTGELGVWIVVPHWALAVPASILPMMWFAGLAKRLRRQRVGLCPVCGYDLRASTGRCPECGTPIQAETRA